MRPTPRLTRPARLGATLLTVVLVASIHPLGAGATSAGGITAGPEALRGAVRPAAPGPNVITPEVRAEIERQIGRTATPAALAPTPLGSFESNSAGAFLGISVATAGDVNGDGYSDIVAIGYVGLSNTALYLFLGSPTGFSLAPGFPVTTLPYGATVVNAAGDVNGDGHADIVMGWPAATAGTIRVFLGTSTGFDIAHPFVDFQNYANFYGQVVGTAGDVNGDGYDDVIIGSPQSGDQIALCAGNLYSNAGRVDVFYGSASGLSSTRRWTIWGCNTVGTGGEMGSAAATAGDVNGDGYDDIVIGSLGAGSGGEIEVLYGSASGLPLLTGYTDVGTLAGSTRIGVPTPGTGFGQTAITAGDVNGDGYADVAVGAPYDNTYATNGGYVRVYLGGPGGLGSSVWWWESSSIANAQLGISITPAGDLNGDGLADLLIGETGKIDVAMSYGTTMVFTSFINVGGSYRSFSTAGDFNGDGLSDVVVGDGSYTNGQSQEGHVVVYTGIGDGPSTTVGYSYTGGGDSNNAGWSVASAGDVNGDGYDDFLIGLPTYNNTAMSETNNGAVLLVYGAFNPPTAGFNWFRVGSAGDQLGISVCRAGDINGDGYGDIIIGAHQPGTGNNGQAGIWYGKPGGLTLNAPPDVTLTGSVPDSQFGSCVTSGDFNGDGYADVAVGAPQEANGALAGAGAVYVYLGSSTGINTTPAWIGRGNQAGAHYGTSIAGDGDINGDGFTDLIVGTPNFEFIKGPTDNPNQGRIQEYFGGAGSPPLTGGFVFNGAGAGDWFGNAVAHVGDVNGDGYGDVAVGSPFATSTLANQGRAVVYAGSVSGLVSTPLWSQYGSETGGGFGSSVAGAGDANGDGLSDVLVGGVFEDGGGATDRGSARVFAGPLPAAAPALWTMYGPSAFANLGHCVANAGDIDGDGFSDLVFGMPGYSDVYDRQGQVWLFHGALGLGHHNGHALTFNRTAHVQPLGFTRDPNFDLRYDAVSAAGRTWSKMQWNVQPAVRLSAPDLSGVQTSFTHALPPNGARASEDTMQVRINGLVAGVPYAWRARSLSRSVYFPTTIWQSPVHSGAREYDIRELGAWVGVGQGPLAADDLSLTAPSPNPMRSRSNISFRLDHAQQVSLTILDVQGRRVRGLVEGMQTAGPHTVTWGGESDDGRAAPDGVYFYRLETGGKVTSRKLALVR